MRALSAIVAGALLSGFAMTFTSANAVSAAGGALNLQANPVPMSDESIKEGGRIYGAACRACHGFRGRGDGVAAPPGTKPANLTDAEWKHGSTDEEIFKNIKEGIPPFDAMKPQKALSDTDIWNVINFVRSLSKPANK
jgi:mono/diheme cytochrome c family protein